MDHGRAPSWGDLCSSEWLVGASAYIDGTGAWSLTLPPGDGVGSQARMPCPVAADSLGTIWRCESGQ
jgi:hypothetical protein